MKRYLCMLLIIVSIAVSAFSSSAFAAQSSNVYLSSDDTGAYVIRFGGKHADITKYASYSESVELDLSHSICAVCAYRDKAVLFCPDYNNNQLIVYVYKLSSDYLDSFAIYGMKLLGNTDFGCDDSAVYLENYRDSRELLTYSYSGVLISRYRFDCEINALCGSFDGGAYVVSGNSLYFASSDGVRAVSGGEVGYPLFPAGHSVLASAAGQIYRLDGDSIMNTFSVDTDHKAASACMNGDLLFYPCDGTVYGYDPDTGEKVCYYSLNGNAELIYSVSDRVAVVGDSSFFTIGRDDFTYLKQPENNDDNADIRSPGSRQISGNNAYNDAVYEISSDEYRVDSERFRITGISPETTVAGFLSNMRYSGYSASVYRDGSQKKSGNAGTAMTVVFSRDNGSITFELGVTGDLTGEGNMNSRDLNTLMDYLIGAADFNGVYADAADLDDSGSVDIADAALMKRKID